MGKTPSLLLALLAAGCASRVPPEPDVPHRFAALENAQAWEKVPRTAAPLPLWARIQMESLPGTTALQVDLDYLHRKRNPLGPVLAARIRKAVAEELHCDYALAMAEADLGDGPPGTDAEALAVEFSRKLTVDAAGLTDEEVAALIEAVGPDDAVAVVHTAAHANFQDRIFLALGLVSEPGGPAPAREVLPAADAEFPVPPREAPAGAVAAEPGELPPWKERTAAELKELLEKQKARAPRIPMPDEVRRARLPRPARMRPARVAWGRVAMAYQPVLTTGWFRTMDAFDREANLDPAFASTVFWVVTRANDCFY